MVQQSNFMGLDGFVWFTGVVEDRNDPEALGRVRVRCIGFHTESVVDLPTDDLPWAHVMHPVTDPAMHGMGSTPSFLVEGSYVIGFFRDSLERQQPIIIGSLPGNPISAANPREGFNDPRGKKSKQKKYAADPKYGPYPVDGDIYTVPSGAAIGEPDTNRLAQGEASETHNSLINRRLRRLSGDPAGFGNGVSTATKPNLSAVSDVAEEETRGFWEEPNPKGFSEEAEPYISSQYPYNHVHESESGHIHEIDDSPGAERLFTEHKSGTFEEIHPRGDKVVKVIGDNYEIIVGGSNVYVSGNVNLTTGTVRHYIKGNYHLEVEGDYTQKIGGNLRTKIGYISGGNLEEEINGNHGYGIKGFVRGNVGPLEGGSGAGEGDVDINIVGNYTTIVGKEATIFSEDNMKLITDNDLTITAFGEMTSATTTGIMSFKSGTKVDMRSTLSTRIESGTTVDIESLLSTKIKSGTKLTTSAGTNWLSTTVVGWDHFSDIGDVSISTLAGNIELNPIAPDLSSRVDDFADG